MLSYRHAFHAGNYADVLKHIVWQQVLLHLNRKDKPYCVVDTHAGAGLYRLQAAESRKTAEYESGIGRLWQDLGKREEMPEVVQDYLQAIAELNPQGLLTAYPGSPWLTAQTLRASDRAWFCELHPKDVEFLQQNLREAGVHPRRVRVLKEDGFQQLIAKLPPQEKRGAVLIDPSYEIKTDYAQVVKALVQAHKRFATGTYVLWYPVVERRRIKQMQQALMASDIRNIHQFELAIAADANSDFGMTASGLFVVNPPWTLPAQMQACLPWLAEQLAGNQGRWLCEALVPE